MLEFGKTYLTIGSQVVRKQSCDGWYLEFNYTDGQWSSIDNEIGSGPPDARVHLQRLAMACLECGTPDQRRAYHDGRKDWLGDVGKAFLAFANSLRQAGCEDEYTFEIGRESKFRVGAIRDAGELYHGISKRMKDTESIALVGSLSPRPLGRDDPGRADYIRRLCNFWTNDLQRRAQSSVTETGAAAGPMVRFLMACANPIFSMRGTAPLTPGAARAEIRAYKARERERYQTIPEVQRQRRRMAKQLRKGRAVSP